jgi:excisionase family DNA binding protein
MNPQFTAVSYDIDGACAATGLSDTTIRAAVARRDLVAHYVGRKPLFRAVELDRWIESLPTEPQKRVAS